MNSLADFAVVISQQQQHKLSSSQDDFEERPPLGGAFSFGPKPLVRLLFILVLLPCLLPLWLVLMPFRLAGKVGRWKQRLQSKSTAKK